MSDSKWSSTVAFISCCCLRLTFLADVKTLHHSHTQLTSVSNYVNNEIEQFQTEAESYISEIAINYTKLEFCVFLYWICDKVHYEQHSLHILKTERKERESFHSVGFVFDESPDGATGDDCWRSVGGPVGSRRSMWWWSLSHRRLINMFPVTSVTSRPVAPIAHRVVVQISSTDNVTEARGWHRRRRRARCPCSNSSRLRCGDVDKLLTMLWTRQTRDVRGTAWRSRFICPRGMRW